MFSCGICGELYPHTVHPHSHTQKCVFTWLCPPLEEAGFEAWVQSWSCCSCRAVPDPTLAVVSRTTGQRPCQWTALPPWDLPWHSQDSCQLVLHIWVHPRKNMPVLSAICDVYSIKSFIWRHLSINGDSTCYESSLTCCLCITYQRKPTHSVVFNTLTSQVGVSQEGRWTAILDFQDSREY